MYFCIYPDLVSQISDPQFNERWISRFGPIQYLSRSHDITLLDFFLSDASKERVCPNGPLLDMEVIKERIRKQMI